jgi:hypothetical protein
MEFLKVMKKFDGGNFHLWRFKMHIMLSKHGLWKFVDGSATIPHDEDEMAGIMKRQPGHLHYFVNISQMHTFNITKMSKELGKHFVVCTKPKPLENKLSL